MQIEMIYKIVTHIAANDRELIAEGSCGSPSCIKVYSDECNVEELYTETWFFGNDYILLQKRDEDSHVVNDSFLGQFVCCHWFDIFSSDCKFKQSLVGDLSNIYVATYVIGSEAATII